MNEWINEWMNEWATYRAVSVLVLLLVFWPAIWLATTRVYMSAADDVSNKYRLGCSVIGRPTGQSVRPVGRSVHTLRQSYRQSDEIKHVWFFRPVGRSVYTIRSSDRPVGQTSRSIRNIRSQDSSFPWLNFRFLDHSFQYTSEKRWNFVVLKDFSRLTF